MTAEPWKLCTKAILLIVRPQAHNKCLLLPDLPCGAWELWDCKQCHYGGILPFQGMIFFTLNSRYPGNQNSSSLPRVPVYQ